MISKAKILSDVDQLPTLPVSFARLSAMARDDESSAEDFEEVLRPDPALTANLLRLANSASFGFQRQINSVRQAVVLLGIKRVVGVAFGAVFARVIPPVLPGYGIDAVAYWRHCVAVAGLTERMAEELGLGDREEAFTCGLLHDIGKLVTSAYLAKQSNAFAKHIRADEHSLVVAEREVLGVDHSEVGAAIADRWDLPTSVCAVVRWHHTPGKADGEENLDLVDSVHIADCLAHAFGYGADVGELSREIDPGAIARLGLTPPGLERIASETASRIDALSASFAETEGDS